MGMFAVKNDKGEWLSFDSSHESVWDTNNPTFFKDKIYAEAQSMGRRAHMVELFEAPAKVVVSEEEAEMLEQAKDDYCAASVISAYSTEHIGAMGQDRLMRAYVNGYIVANENKYNVKVPHTKDVWYYKQGDTDLLTSCPVYKELRGKFTEEEITHYGLQDCEKEEVTDDE